MFADYDARGPFERAPGYGFRLAKYIQPLPPAVTAPVRIEALVRDVRQQKPGQRRHLRGVSTAVRLRSHTAERRRRGDRRDRDLGEAHRRLRRRLRRRAHARASLPAEERVAAVPDRRLLPGGRRVSSCDRAATCRSPAVDFIIPSGRAFLYPVYKGTYERTLPDEMGPNAERELRIAWSRDLGRAIDYLETRSDIDRTRLAFYGVSAGAEPASS